MPVISPRILFFLTHFTPIQCSGSLLFILIDNECALAVKAFPVHSNIGRNFYLIALRFCAINFLVCGSWVQKHFHIKHKALGEHSSFMFSEFL